MSSLNRRFGKSKAKAALAVTGNISSTPSDIRLTALEAVALIALNNGAFYDGGFGAKTRKVTSDYLINTVDSVILGDATSLDIVVTLPAPSTSWDGGRIASLVYNISKIDSSVNTVTIAPNGSETIAGDSSFVLEYQNEVLSLVTDGTNWYLKD